MSTASGTVADGAAARRSPEGLAPGHDAGTARGHGDVDTTCAITGPVVAAGTGVEGVPAVRPERREPLPGAGRPA
ncbi:hypothetical protein [Streptomyces phaeofaciens]|uniref:hypothetical protein n=1 Tax=Streptomyces phaeofaciens TaxID=68254 RepID=UPI00368C15F8